MMTTSIGRPDIPSSDLTDGNGHLFFASKGAVSNAQVMRFLFLIASAAVVVFAAVNLFLFLQGWSGVDTSAVQAPELVRPYVNQPDVSSILVYY